MEYEVLASGEDNSSSPANDYEVLAKGIPILSEHVPTQSRYPGTPEGRANVAEDLSNPGNTAMGVFESATPMYDASDLNPMADKLTLPTGGKGSRNPSSVILADAVSNLFGFTDVEEQAVSGIQAPESTPTGKHIGNAIIGLTGGKGLKNVATSRIDDVVLNEAKSASSVVNANLGGKGNKNALDALLKPPTVKLLDKVSFGKAGQVYSESIGKMVNSIVNKLGYSRPKARALTSKAYRDTLDSFGVKSQNKLKPKEMEKFWEMLANNINGTVSAGIKDTGSLLPATGALLGGGSD